MLVRAHFKNIDEVIATIKAPTIKNKDRLKDFHDAGLTSPPDPVITRWAIWLRAALYYSENLPAVRTIVSNWTSAGLLVSRAKDAINVEGLVSDLVKIIGGGSGGGGGGGAGGPWPPTFFSGGA